MNNEIKQENKPEEIKAEKIKQEEKIEEVPIEQVLETMNFNENRFKEFRQKRQIHGRKLNPNVIQFNTKYTNCLNITEHEGYIWKPENFIVRILAEGLPYSLSSLIRQLKSRMSKKDRLVKISKREMLKFLLSLTDLTVAGSGFNRMFVIDISSEKKIKDILMKKDKERDRVDKHFKEKILEEYNDGVKKYYAQRDEERNQPGKLINETNK